MRKSEGRIGGKLFECINPGRDKWIVRWDVKPHDGGEETYMEELFDHRPTMQEVESLLLGWYNQQINERILSGFIWNDMPVWLSSENQFNYKAAYDLAVQTNGATLPVIFKFGTCEHPVYHVFETVQELSDFYLKAMVFVNETLEQGWKQKDAIEWEKYV